MKKILMMSAALLMLSTTIFANEQASASCKTQAYLSNLPNSQLLGVSSMSIVKSIQNNSQYKYSKSLGACSIKIEKDTDGTKDFVLTFKSNNTLIGDWYLRTSPELEYEVENLINILIEGRIKEALRDCGCSKI